jgi:hypothetical protein
MDAVPQSGRGRCITFWSSGPAPASLAGPLTAHVRFQMTALKWLLVFALAGSCWAAGADEPKLGTNAVRSSNTWTELEVTSLHAAIRSGDIASVTQMLEAKGNANAFAANGATPLYALFQRHPFPGGAESQYAIALTLFRFGANPNEFLPPRPLTAGGVRAATWALQRGSTRITKLFLDAGLDASLKNASGSPVLFTAISVNSIESADLLILAGASVNDTDSFGQNCLFRARTPEMGKFLVQRGVNISKRDHEGVSVVAKLRDQSGYCGSAGCSEIPAAELALASYLESIGAPPK